MNIMLDEFKKMLLLLLKHNVEFMLIGGYAVIYYGYERSTSDMDIWLKPSNTNRDKLIHVFEEFGISKSDIAKVAKCDFTQTQFFYFGQKPQKVDFLTKINGVDYAEAEKEMNYFPFDSVRVPIIQYHHLILSKISNERAKDKADVEELQRINKYKKKGK